MWHPVLLALQVSALYANRFIFWGAISALPFEISTYNPSYFVDMTYKGPTALHLPLVMAQQCNLSLITPKPDTSLRVYALSLDKNDSPGEDRALGQQFAQRVTLQCQ